MDASQITGSHSLADSLPMLNEDRYSALRDSISVHGQREPVMVTPDGLVLDGRNRLKACHELGIEPIIQVVSADMDGLADVVATANYAQRGLSKSQLAIGAARVIFVMRREGDPPRTIRSLVSDFAARTGLGVSTIDDAWLILQSKDIPLILKVESGQLSVSKARLILYPKITSRVYVEVPKNTVAHDVALSARRVYQSEKSERSKPSQLREPVNLDVARIVGDAAGMKTDLGRSVNAVAMMVDHADLTLGRSRALNLLRFFLDELTAGHNPDAAALKSMERLKMRLRDEAGAA